METIRPPYSEPDVLLCLKQSAILLDSMLARWRMAAGGLSADEQHAMSRNLSTIAFVLRFLGEQIIPPLLVKGDGLAAQRRQDAIDTLMRLYDQTIELRLHFGALSATSN